MLETVPAVVVVLDAQGRLVELNRAGEELTGYSGEELRGRELWETGLVPEEEQSGTREVFARLRAGDFPNRYENHWITKDGRSRLLSWRNSAVLDEHGEVSHVIGTAVDVTDERRALDALQESAERFRATLQTLVDPLVLLTAARDADGTVVDFVCAFANDAACAVHGVAPRSATSAGMGLSCTRCMGRRWCATRTGDRRCSSARCRTSPSASGPRRRSAR